MLSRSRLRVGLLIQYDGGDIFIRRSRLYLYRANCKTSFGQLPSKLFHQYLPYQFHRQQCQEEV